MVEEGHKIKPVWVSCIKNSSFKIYQTIKKIIIIDNSFEKQLVEFIYKAWRITQNLLNKDNMLVCVALSVVDKFVINITARIVKLFYSHGILCLMLVTL